MARDNGGGFRSSGAAAVTQGDPSWCGLDLSEAFAAGHALADVREARERMFAESHPGMSWPLSRAILQAYESEEERVVGDLLEAVRRVAAEGEALAVLRQTAREVFAAGYVSALARLTR